MEIFSRYVNSQKGGGQNQRITPLSFRFERMSPMACKKQLKLRNEILSSNSFSPKSSRIM